MYPMILNLGLNMGYGAVLGGAAGLAEEYQYYGRTPKEDGLRNYIIMGIALGILATCFAKPVMVCALIGAAIKPLLTNKESMGVDVNTSFHSVWEAQTRSRWLGLVIGMIAGIVFNWTIT